MKSRLALTLFSLPIAATLAAKDAGAAATVPVNRTSESDRLTPGGILAAQVGEIASTKDLSHRSKSRQIASAVRLAVTTVSTNLDNPDKALQLVLELAARAAKAAPDFAEVVSEATLDAGRHVPLLARLSGLKDQVQDAVAAGVKAAAKDSDVVYFDSEPSKPPAKPEFRGRTDDVIVSPSH